MAMDKFKEKLGNLREEADLVNTSAEETEAKLKIAKLAQQERDQEILNLKSRVTLLKMELLKIGKRAEEHKALETDAGSSENPDQLNDKINDLESQVEETKLELSKTLESIRQLDIKSEHLAKTLIKNKKDQETWESKNEVLRNNLEATNKELQDALSLLDEL
ncbi:tropomyosin-2 [Entomophthora muscae]|uniref:Tropomyosin-2 n=1 Tax=Entomophthora muscae TaxID=34485 RepID=A0ACC2ST00_9FUNG|nr:tropomyosin-2 [Entomophthora muscae]